MLSGIRTVNRAPPDSDSATAALPPWEMDSDNPTFKDNWHKNVQCLNDRGLKVIETEPGSWTYDGQPTMSSDEQKKVQKECEQQVFGGGGK